MTFFEQFFSNTIFLTAAFGWLVAQILKTLIHLIVSKKFVAMAGLTLAGRYTFFLVSAALIAVHGVYLLSVFQLLFAAGLFRQVTFHSPVPAALR